MTIPKVILPDVLGDVSNGLAVAGLINNVKSTLNTVIDEKEELIGNPSVDGQILASTVEGVRSWVTPSTGGGGGGSIELQKDGTQVVAEASVLNFTEGLYVDGSGNISTSLPSALDWSIDISDPLSTPQVTQPTVNGLSWTGSAGAGFSSVPAASFATVIRQGMYFEITAPAAVSDVGFVQLRAAAPSASGFFGPITEDYVSLNWQGGTLGSLPTGTGGTPLNQALNQASYTFGLEFATDGVYHHADSVRTKIRDALTGPLSLNTLVADPSGAPRTLTLDPNPTLPVSVEAGVTTLQGATEQDHPLSVFDTNLITLPEEISEAEVLAGTESGVRLVSAVDLQLAAQTHSRVPVSGKQFATSSVVLDRVDRVAYTNTDGQDYGLEMSIVSGTANLSVRGPAPLDPSDYVSTTGLEAAVDPLIEERSGGLYVTSAGGLISTPLPSWISGIAKTGTGLYRLNFPSSQAINNYIVNVQIEGANYGDEALVSHNSDYIQISTRASGDIAADKAMYITWHRRSTLSA